jgi:hypothetical protein
MITIYVGTEPNQKLAYDVMRHSVLSRTKAPVRFVPLDGSQLMLPMSTGFSFCRWSVPDRHRPPERVIYMDADICVLGDIAELYALPMQRPVLARAYGAQAYFTSVMLLDCARLQHWSFEAWVDRARENVNFYNTMMWGRPGAPNHEDLTTLPECWNDLDILKPTTKALHYTGLTRQPWRYNHHPAGHVFHQELKAAMKSGAITEEDVRAEIKLGHVRDDVLMRA